VVHLGDRDCSLQRRHQKVIEEAPAPDIPAPVRLAMHEAAVRLAATLSYESAGTVEFLYDRQQDAFHFLEVNTRLQVEHPVTEMVTGVDIVAAQLAIAAGDGLDASGGTAAPGGHAIEARIAAEIPEQGFRPSPGRIVAWAMPSLPGLRIDTYCEPGAMVPPFYDSLIGKVIAHAPDRRMAIERLSAALGQMTIEGIGTNRAFLLRLLCDPDFRAMRHNTRHLDAAGAGLVTGSP
jgi:acetyl-CoA carboxylase biotin carboxylase subunit